MPVSCSPPKGPCSHRIMARPVSTTMSHAGVTSPNGSSEHPPRSEPGACHNPTVADHSAHINEAAGNTTELHFTALTMSGSTSAMSAAIRHSPCCDSVSVD